MSTSPAVTRFCLVSIKLRQVKHIPGKKQKQLGVEAIQQLSVTKKKHQKTPIPALLWVYRWLILIRKQAGSVSTSGYMLQSQTFFQHFSECA